MSPEDSAPPQSLETPVFTQEPDNHWAAGLAETKSVSLLYAEGRSERLALFDFLRDLSNVFHVPPRHWQPVAHRFPPPPRSLARVSRHLHLWLRPEPRVVCLCPRPPRHDGKHAGEPESGLWGWNSSWWPRLVFKFLPFICLQLQPGRNRLPQGPRKPGGLAAQCHTSCPEPCSLVTGSGHAFGGKGNSYGTRTAARRSR